MIFTERQITVHKGKSLINEPVILYRGDYEVSITFTIMESKFRFKSGANFIDTEKASHGQLAILAPYGGNVFSEIVTCKDGTVTFTLTKEMIDKLEEVGLYSFQIRLFDYYRESRVSIPPVEFGIEVREPVASEDHDNTVNNAIVGYSIAKVVDPKEENVGPTFNVNGQYNKTDWETGDRITEGKLNNIEDAIDKINKNEKADINALNKRVSSNFNVVQNQINNLVLESGGDSNLEVVQSRIDIEGVNHGTLKNRIDAIEEILTDRDVDTLRWVRGTLDVDGTENESNVRLRSNFLPIHDVITGTIASGYMCKFYYYDEQKNYIRCSASWVYNTLNIQPDYSYFRILLSREDSSTISLEEQVAFNANISTMYVKLAYEYEVDELDNRLTVAENTLYFGRYKPIGNFVHGNANADDTIDDRNKNRAIAVKVFLYKNASIGFIDSGYDTYEFAIEPSGDGLIDWIPSTDGSYHLSDYTVEVEGYYNIMIAKNDNSTISTDEMDEINNIFVTKQKSIVDEIEEIKDTLNKRTVSSYENLYEKTIVALGDSFIDYRTQGLGNDLLSKIAEGNNMTIYNYGLSSSSLAYDKNQTVSSGMDRYKQMLNEVPKADYVLVLMGHNDSNPSLHGGTAIPIGENSDNITTTFKGALNILITALLNQYPTAGILFLTPFNRRGTELPYVKAMEEICELYSVPCFNNYKSSGICFQNQTHLSTYDVGNFHLNARGNEKMAKKYKAILNTL